MFDAAAVRTSLHDQGSTTLSVERDEEAAAATSKAVGTSAKLRAADRCSFHVLCEETRLRQFAVASGARKAVGRKTGPPTAGARSTRRLRKRCAGAAQPARWIEDVHNTSLERFDEGLAASAARCCCCCHCKRCRADSIERGMHLRRQRRELSIAAAARHVFDEEMNSCWSFSLDKSIVPEESAAAGEPRLQESSEPVKLVSNNSGWRVRKSHHMMPLPCCLMQRSKEEQRVIRHKVEESVRTRIVLTRSCAVLLANSTYCTKAQSMLRAQR